MIAVHLPSFPNVETALDWLDEQGDVVRACLLRGEDGMIRGNAIVRLRA